MNINVIIVDSENEKLAIKYLYIVDGYLTFNVKVKSGEFAGASNFCTSKEELLLIIESLSKMHDKLIGSCKISDNDSDAYINIEMDKLGHMYISGQIGGSHEDHNMKFKYITDQTILTNLIQALKEFLK